MFSKVRALQTDKEMRLKTLSRRICGYVIKQVAQLSQTDCAAGWVGFGQSRRRYSADIIWST